MNAADLIKHCNQYEEEHGLDAAIELLEDIIRCKAQSAGFDIEYVPDEDDDGADAGYMQVTLQ